MTVQRCVVEGDGDSGANPVEPGADQSRHTWRDYVRALGPGMISGAADNDPTTVATMAVVGSTTAYRLSLLTILVYPMLAAIQIISARVGTVTKRGLQRVVVKEYGRGWGFLLLLSILAVNVVTIAADLEGGAAALGLIFHVPWQWFIVPFAAAVLAMLVFGSYHAIQSALKWVLLVFLAYVASALVAHPNWGAVLHDTVLPSLSFNHDVVQGALAILGTTLTSYAYVWESIEQAEERPPITQLGLTRADAGIGMLLAVAVFWFILIGTAATLGVHHKQVQTAQDAAQALVPVAGPIAAYLFAAGLLASAILAVPVIAATSAYVLGQEFGWRSSLSASPWRAVQFYAALGISLAVGCAISFLGVSPIQLLLISSIAGGVGTPVSLAFLLLVANNRRIMGDEVPKRAVTIIGWATLLLVSAISVYFLWQQFL
ncbi:MAG: divalent metal cation transporter [Chloroflexi bacterium]|nr:divalent metal cation transporter [Chloroflexota bacterium]